MDMKALGTLLQQNGVVCSGGANFPIYTKFDERTETIILNCSQYEPLIRVQTQLLDKYAQEIIGTFSMLGEASGAKEIIIGMSEVDKDTIETVQAVMEDYPNLTLRLYDGSYPSGDEVVLIYELTGRVIGPNSSPAELGISVFTVECIYNVYRALMQEKPVTDKVVSVLGEVKDPITVRVPIGTPLEEVVRLAGGITCKNPVYFVGGPMWGHIGKKISPVTKSTDAVLILPEEHIVVQKKRSNSPVELKRAASACCQCMLCTELCPRKLLGHPVEPHAFMRAASYEDVQNPEIFINTMFCSSCGLCEMFSCIQGLSPRTLMAEYKAGLRKHGLKKPEVDDLVVSEDREYRKVPMERLTARLDLLQYDKADELDEAMIMVKKVKIPLNQHIGAPAAAVVKCGDMVTEGQMIAEPSKGMSAAIHASIDGKVIEVNKKFIILEH